MIKRKTNNIQSTVKKEEVKRKYRKKKESIDKSLHRKIRIIIIGENPPTRS